MPQESTHCLNRAGTLVSEHQPLPIMLLLESSMTGQPWAGLTARAEVSLQLRDVVADLVGAGTQATLEDAIFRQRVQRVLVCCEGPHTLFRHAELAVRTRKVASLVRSFTRRRACQTSVGAAWFVADEHSVRQFAVHPVRMDFQPVAPGDAHHDALHTALHEAVIDAMSTDVSPWSRHCAPS